MTRYFTPALFTFLNDLADNNKRPWFDENKDRFESDVREPALDFITGFADTLESISPHFLADARKSGGSLFRIHRDIRFGKDKTPFKTNTGMHFRHERAKDAHAPGFYLHLQPGECFIGVGLWRPETKVAYDIRAFIDAQPDKWRTATQTSDFTDRFALAGDSLKRPPKGYDPDHPLVDDLKRKDFIATAPVTQRMVTSASFDNLFEEHCRAASPFMAFVCEAVGVDF